MVKEEAQKNEVLQNGEIQKADPVENKEMPTNIVKEEDVVISTKEPKEEKQQADEPIIEKAAEKSKVKELMEHQRHTAEELNNADPGCKCLLL